MKGKVKSKFMIFLNPLYQQVYTTWAGRINHFPLIRLIFLSLDKTIFYFLIWILLRFTWRRLRKIGFSGKRELTLGLFVIYLLLLFTLTVFREGYFPWDFQIHWQRPLSVINFNPLIETVKLLHGRSLLDFFYNSIGNLVWFIPWGILFPLVQKKQVHFPQTFISGLLLSLVIETLQFFLITGVTDIDDVIFNTLGAMIGYAILRFITRIRDYHF